MNMNVNMNDDTVQAQRISSYLFSANGAYIEELYEQYLHDPQSIDISFRNYFASLPHLQSGEDFSHAEIRAYFQDLAKQPLMPSTAPVTNPQHERKQQQVLLLIEAYRNYGHYHAKLDPLELSIARPMPELDLTHHGLTSVDLNTAFEPDGLVSFGTLSLKEIQALLQRTYCGTIGFEYKHLSDSRESTWFQHRVEQQQGNFSGSLDAKQRILQRLVEAEGLERYLGAKYVGQTRFSLEGGDSLIPMLDGLIQSSSQAGIKEIIMGMGHRGRLNVLINILGKSATEICQGFEGKLDNHQGSGDVKYHLGYASNIKTTANNSVIHLALAFNPSHLEIIDPVVEGSVRARQQHRGDEKRAQVIPVLIHGDAAFAGQGVVMETFALSQTPGATTGGTIHIVVNNQIGFTTSNRYDARSSWYCTDIAKMVEAPIIHVNSDDPEATLFAINLALDFRMAFNKDVVIDLVCYRRHGHNEGDEPSATQPMMYQKIKQRPTALKLYGEALIAAGITTQAEIDAKIKRYRELLDQGHEIVNTSSNHDKYATDWSAYLGQDWTAPAKTAVTLTELKTYAQALAKLPEDFALQPQVAKIMADRAKMTAGEIPVDWGYAETMAYASLLAEGYPVRITGQDVGRGTFYHRHAVLHNYQNDQIYIPLAHTTKTQATFTIFDSILSESAVMGFEYGYASSSPESLVIWEAQYGDFVNGAQVIVDQFISSAEQKWGRLCGLVLYLPHGYEGAGPEHSSARLERFLQLCAEHNMQVCVPSNAAQIFHLVRRQMLRPFRKPLIVMTPKSLLRLNSAKSSLEDLAQGEFQLVIPEIDAIKPEQVRRVIMCSGKVYYDLLEQRRTAKTQDIAIIRVEQLYPFPEQELAAELNRYKKTKDIVWCQEEPKNQGAWYSLQHHFTACLAKGQILNYAGRAASASPAAGAKILHTEQQKAFVNEALQ